MRGTDPRALIDSGAAVLGVEFGSTRIKACLICPDTSAVLAVGASDWENTLVNGLWSYPLEDVWAGLQHAYRDLQEQVKADHGTTITKLGALGVSAMMHGYLAFDEAGDLLVPFRTWRNANTGPATEALTELFGVNIPHRWSIAHLQQAIIDGEEHVEDVRFLTTLAGYVHWRLTGRKVLGVGDASGMFPVDGGNYDPQMLAAYNRYVEGGDLAVALEDLLPEVLLAGEDAGHLTQEGARLLDPTGALQPGAPMCPPEGDAGTGMVATNAIAPRTGNVSVGTSIFAMVVLEKPFTGIHPEIDLVATPVGDGVAMVHCNNGASELSSWIQVFSEFAQALGAGGTTDEYYSLLFSQALEAEADAGEILAYNHLSGEPIAGTSRGCPLVVRTPTSRFTLANFMRASLYGVYATLALGMRTLAAEGVRIDQIQAHGGIFRTPKIAQRYLAAALDAPVAVMGGASEGGAWGIAVLAAYLGHSATQPLNEYLDERVFTASVSHVEEPDADDVRGFTQYLDRYEAGLELQRTAVRTLVDTTTRWE